jgi:hypothetical protein
MTEDRILLLWSAILFIGLGIWIGAEILNSLMFGGTLGALIFGGPWFYIAVKADLSGD